LPRLAKKIRVVAKSPIRRITALLDEATNRPEIISFGGGAPSLPPAKEVVDEIIAQLQKNSLGASAYTGTRGRAELLELIGQDLKKYGGIDVDPKKEITLTDGATEGILLALMAIVDPDDEVIITDPTYLGFPEAVKLVDGRIVRLPVCVEEGCQPNLEKLKKLVTKKTKAFILLSPDNPTGRVVEEERVKAIVDLASAHDFWIISDDTYKHILYEGEHVWVSKLPKAWERTITLHTFSKEASLPGLRLGYAYGPAEAIDAMEKFKQYTSLAPNAISQLALIRFLSGDLKERYLRDTVIPTYLERRNVMGEYVRRYLPEAKTVKPNGAFYYFVNMRAYLNPIGMSDEQFSEELVQRKRVAVIPGTYFGLNGKQHIRLTFVSEPIHRIEQGLKKIGEFFKKR